MLEFFLALIVIMGIIMYAIWKKVQAEEEQKKKKLILMQAKRHLEIIDNSKDIINKSKNFSTIQSRFNVIFENIEKLKELAQLYPDISKPTPIEIETFYKNEKEKFITEFVLEEVDDIYQKAQKLSGVKTKTNTINKAILKIIEGIKELEKQENIEKLKNKEKELRTYIHKIKLDEFLEKAKKADFMGKKAKAIDAYKEALYFLKTDEIENSQQLDEIEEIERKIKELSE